MAEPNAQTPQPEATPPRERRGLSMPVAAVLAALIGTLGSGGIVGGLVTHWISSSSAQTGPSRVSNEGQVSHSPNFKKLGLRFIPPVSGTVPFCRTYLGVGTIPKGYTLLVFDVPRDGSRRWYFLDPRVQVNSPGTWSVGPVFVGPPTDGAGHLARLDGLLVTNQEAKFIWDFIPESATQVQIPESHLTWQDKVLPPYVLRFHLNLVRNSKSGNC